MFNTGNLSDIIISVRIKNTYNKPAQILLLSKFYNSLSLDINIKSTVSPEFEADIVDFFLKTNGASYGEDKRRFQNGNKDGEHSNWSSLNS